MGKTKDGPYKSKLGWQETAKSVTVLSLGQGRDGRAEITGRGVRLGSEAFTQLLHEDPSHLLRQNPAGVDEARQVASCAELHDEVDVVTVPLGLEAERRLEEWPFSAPFGGQPIPSPHLEVFQLYNVGVSNALEDLNLCQEVFHGCLVQTLLGHTLYGYHLPSILLWGQEIQGLCLERARNHAWPEGLWSPLPCSSSLGLPTHTSIQVAQLPFLRPIRHQDSGILASTLASLLHNPFHCILECPC